MGQSGRAYAAQNDQEFMDSVYTRYSRLMFHTAKKYTSDFMSAEDIVQDVFEKLIHKIATLQKLNSGALTSYIAMSVKNTSINTLRKKKADHTHMSAGTFDEDEIDAWDNSLSPEDVILSGERSSALRRAWAKLPEKDQDLLIGRYIFGLNNKELAEMCGCKPDSIRMLLTRARQRAFKMMKEESLSYDET